MRRPTSAALLLLVFLAGGLGRSQAAQGSAALVVSVPDAVLPDDPSVHLEAAPIPVLQKRFIPTMGPTAAIHAEAILRAGSRNPFAVVTKRSSACTISTAHLFSRPSSSPRASSKSVTASRTSAPIAEPSVSGSVPTEFSTPRFTSSPTQWSRLLHEDPRYYIEGSQHSVLHRTLYAATRTILTRTDNSNTRISKALLLGCAASSALENTYYSLSDRTFVGTANSFAGSI